MSIDLSGLDAKPKSIPVTITPRDDHALISLAQRIPWSEVAEVILPDLKATTAKGLWHLGRRLKLRIHLGTYLLQLMHDLTDRQAEWQITDNAVYQIFCGLGLVEKFHVPDHTKIEEFRSRLSPDTKCAIANILAKAGVALNFGEPSKMDQDSTVQEAGITYPSDARLLVKMAGLCRKVFAHFAKLLPEGDVEAFNFKQVKAKAREYLFAKAADLDEKRENFKSLYYTAFLQCCKVMELDLAKRHLAAMPWNVRRAWEQVKVHGKKYFQDVADFMASGAMVAGKAMSFHQSEIACFNKGKEGKGLQFGRQFQLGRIGGNFLIVTPSDTVRMDDKQAVGPMIALHQQLFGEGTLTSFGTDKGYYSAANTKAARTNAGLKELGMQRPGPDRIKTEEERAVQQRMANRRSGIEPLIGHAKHGGQLGRSRMKTDRSTLGSGYGAVAGFNLRQLLRHLIGKEVAAMP